MTRRAEEYPTGSARVIMGQGLFGQIGGLLEFMTFGYVTRRADKHLTGSARVIMGKGLFGQIGGCLN